MVAEALAQYQKTESVIKATTEKTTSILGGLGSGITSKIGQLKNSESFKSFEERVGSAYENVKATELLEYANTLFICSVLLPISLHKWFKDRAARVRRLKSIAPLPRIKTKPGSTKVSTSRSSSMQSFDDALRETEGRNVTSPVTTPTIKEEPIL